MLAKLVLKTFKMLYFINPYFLVFRCNKTSYFASNQRINKYSKLKEDRIFYFLKLLFNLLGWSWLIKLYRVQAYNSRTHHLHIILCVHHLSQVSCLQYLSPLYPPLPPATPFSTVMRHSNYNMYALIFPIILTPYLFY